MPLEAILGRCKRARKLKSGDLLIFVKDSCGRREIQERNSWPLAVAGGVFCFYIRFQSGCRSIRFFVKEDMRNYSAAGQRRSEDGECPIYWSYVEKATEN